MSFPASYEFDGRGVVVIDGFTLRGEIVPDEGCGAPWEEEDGHGEVSAWRRRDYAGRFHKAPGELLLHDDGGGLHGGRARFYDFAGACRKALAEGWDAEPYNTGQETPRQRAAKAARADFDRLRAWCTDTWHYAGVCVIVSRLGIDLGRASLWGIESDDELYLRQVANELTGEALDDARATLAALCDCAAAA